MTTTQIQLAELIINYVSGADVRDDIIAIIG